MAMLTPLRSDGDRITLPNVGWRLYAQLRDDPSRSGVRMTYHRGVLELMSPSGPHERICRLLELLVAEWCVHHRIARATFGSTTYRREDLQSGLEPDACFYIEHEADVRDHEEIDLAIHPPPDLALEVEISRSAAGRLAIYAEMGVPEVWRTDGDVLRMFRLDDQGTYREVRESQALPGLKPDDLCRFLALRTEVDESTLTIQFREWMSGGAR